MRLTKLLFLTGLVVSVSSVPLCVSSPSSLGICLRPLFDTWEHIRNVESHSTNLLFPVPFYTRNSTILLCDIYEQGRQKCFPEGGCESDPMLSFVTGQLGFFCGPIFPAYIERYDCISASLLRSRHCLQSIFGMPNPLSDKDRCRGLPKFFSCITPSLEKACGQVAVGLIAGAINHFGCALKEDTKFLSELRALNDSDTYTYDNLHDFLAENRPSNGASSPRSSENDQASSINTSKTIPQMHDILNSTSSENSNPSDEPVPHPKRAKSVTSPVIVEVTSSSAHEPTQSTMDLRSQNTSEEVHETYTTQLVSDNMNDPETSRMTTDHPLISSTEIAELHGSLTDIHMADQTMSKSVINANSAEVDDNFAFGNTTNVATEVNSPENVGTSTSFDDFEVRSDDDTESPVLNSTKIFSTSDVFPPGVPERTSDRHETMFELEKSPVFDVQSTETENRMFDAKLVQAENNSSSHGDMTLAEVSDSEVLETPSNKKIFSDDVVSKTLNDDTDNVAPLLHDYNDDLTRSIDDSSSDSNNNEKSNNTSIDTTSTSNLISAMSESDKMNTSNDEGENVISEENHIDKLAENMLSTVEETNGTEASSITTMKTPESLCREEDQDFIAACHSNLVSRLASLSVANPYTVRVRFPLFNMTSSTVFSLCQEYEEGNKCAREQRQRCTETMLLDFLARQFESICFRIDTMKEDYECMQETINQNKNCIKYISDTSPDQVDKCDGQQTAFDCYSAVLECAEGARTLYKEMMRGYGCRVDTKRWLAHKPTTTTTIRTTWSRRPRKSTNQTTATVSSTVPTTVAQPTVTSNTHSPHTYIPETTISPSTTTELVDEPILNSSPMTAIELEPEAVENNLNHFETMHDDPNSATETEAIDVEGASEPLETNDNDELVTTEPTTSITVLEDTTELPSELGSTSEKNSENDMLGSGEEQETENIPDDQKMPLENEEVATTPKMTVISPDCSSGERNKARVCVAPLMRTWVGLRRNRPSLTKSSFPVYLYTRVELLELCDGYANSFLCAGMLPIKHCIEDELIRFAQDHLGYQCSPPNIERFMTHYDCILEIEQTTNCRQHVSGVSAPGKDQNKCDGVSAYRDCMLPMVREICQQGAVAEFDHSVTQFGCDFSDTSV